MSFLQQYLRKRVLSPYGLNISRNIYHTWNYLLYQSFFPPEISYIIIDYLVLGRKKLDHINFSHVLSQATDEYPMKLLNLSKMRNSENCPFVYHFSNFWGDEIIFENIHNIKGYHIIKGNIIYHRSKQPLVRSVGLLYLSQQPYVSFIKEDTICKLWVVSITKWYFDPNNKN